jgi:hypothetical protein
MNRVNSTFVFAALGLATGLVTMVMQPFGGFAYDWIQGLVEPVREGFIGFLIKWGIFLLPGLIFGAVLGQRFTAMKLGGRWHWLLFSAVCAASWYFGIYAALNLSKISPVDPEDYLLMGPAGGLVGAAIVALGGALLYPALRNGKTAIMLIVIGAGLGLLLHVDIDAPHILFPPWQAAIAACLGYAARRAAP